MPNINLNNGLYIKSKHSIKTSKNLKIKKIIELKNSLTVKHLMHIDFFLQKKCIQKSPVDGTDIKRQ